MTLARVGAATLFIVGVIIGTVIDQRAPATPTAVGEYVVLAGDFHVHSFGGDGVLPPWALRREAARVGLDVVAVTNHNQTFAARFARWVAGESDGPMIIVGEEITGRNYHLIAAGIETPVSWNQHAASAVEDTQRQGGVAIAAHPVERYWEGLDDRSITVLDGVEAAHPMHQFRNWGQELSLFHRRARVLNAQIAAIGSSDFHASPAMGRCRTYLLVSENTEAGVLDAIREGRTVAVDRDGQLHGDRAWTQLVATIPARPVQRGAACWVSNACAWLGLLGMIAFGRRYVDRPSEL